MSMWSIDPFDLDSDGLVQVPEPTKTPQTVTLSNHG